MEKIGKTILVFSIFVFFSITAILFLNEWGRQQNTILPPYNLNQEYVHPFSIDGNDILVAIADTNEARIQGLSGQEGLAENTGLLFVFDKEDTHGIWMKDMNFSIDIVWLDSAGRVVHTEPSVSPDTFPKIFSSPIPARYVLELPAGFLERSNIKIGSVASF